MSDRGRPGLSAAHEAARAVSRRVGRHIDWNDKTIEFARIMSVKNPMQIELFSGPVLLQEDRDWKMTQFVRWWDLNYQLMPLDVLLLLRLDDHTRIAFDVRTDRDVEAGIRPSRPPASATGDMRPAEDSHDPQAGYAQQGLAADLTLPASTIPVSDASIYRPSGRVFVFHQDEPQSGQEVAYTGKTLTTLTGCTGGAGFFDATHRVPIVSQLTYAHHIVKKLEVYDHTGARIGYVPVYGDLP